MATLREIRGHINSVRSIAKVTRAMEMVAAARGHRLATRVESTRPFAERSWEVLGRLASAAEGTIRQNPAFCGHPESTRLGLVLVTSSRGMVGSYNQNVIALADRTRRQRGLDTEVVAIGTAGRQTMLRGGVPIYADFPLDERVALADLTSVARLVLDEFVRGRFHEVLVVYTGYRSRSRMRPTVLPLLPIRPELAANPRQYFYEPEPGELLLALLPRLIRFQLYQAVLESLAAENVARQLAMREATQNADGLIAHLTQSYHKARQQAITAEILDILGGAAAPQPG